MRKFLITGALLLTLGTWGLAQAKDNVNIVGTPQVRAQNNTAVISWQTDKNAATQVKYGTDPSNMSQKAYEAGGSRNHNVTLQNLQQGKTYYFAILDNDGNVRQQGQFVAGQSGTQSAGNMGSSSGSSGYPNATGKQDNVVITSPPSAVNIQPTSATIQWQTDDIAATHVKYGTDANNPSQSAYEPGGSRTHQVQLSNLQPGQTYYIQILRRDGSVRTTAQFQTPQQGQSASAGGWNQPQQSGQNAAVQITSGPNLETVGDRYAVVTWTTAQPASSAVRVGTDPNNMPMTAQSQWGTTHRVQLGGLQPNTHYYFEIGSAQQPGQQAATSQGQFTTVNQGAAAVQGGTWRRP